MKLIISTAACILITLGLCFWYVSASTKDNAPTIAANIQALDQWLNSNKYLDARQIRSIEVNNLWEQKVQAPEDITDIFIGSSRTKYLHPTYVGLPNALVVGGNSYNEISYGSLIEAEILRERFPNVKRFFIETSLLHRRAMGLHADADHLRYLNWLDKIAPVLDELNIQHDTSTLNQASKLKIDDLEWIKKAKSLRISSLLGYSEETNKWNTFLTSEISKLDQHGQYPLPDLIENDPKDILPPITATNPKVQRIVGASERIPGDKLFEAFALWGKQNNIEIVFYQPPVRDDLLTFKLNNGLDKHVDDLKSIAEKYNILFIDMNSKNNGFTNNRSLFSDEDHANTCKGSIALSTALVEQAKYKSKDLYKKVDMRPYLEQTVWKEICKIKL